MYKVFILVSFILISFISKQSDVSTKKFKVGLSICSTSNTWRKSMIVLMQNELLNYTDIQLIIKDARGNCEEQQKHIKEFIDQGIDLLIISPNISTPIKSSIDKINEYGIPILLIDRKIVGANYTSYLGGNNYKVGYDAGEYAAKLLKGKGRIIEIKGSEGSSPTIERENGFKDAITRFPNIKVVFSDFGNWQVGSAELIMKKIANKNLAFDLVFAHNDLMAEEASKFIRNNNLNKKCYVIGVDGLPGNKGGIQAIIDRRMNATFYYPPQGDRIIKIANNILHHLPYEKENFIDAILIDSTNAKGLKSQSLEIDNLQAKIDKQENALSTEISKYKTQRLIITFILISSFLILMLIVFIIKAILNKKAVNKLLERKRIIRESKNTAIKLKQKELVEVTKKLEDATKSKLDMFTKISHEFKTPLTLITGPLEFLIKSKNFKFEDEQQLRLMYRNSMRLLRLVNQLIDFQNLEKNNLNLNASECDFISFLNEKKETFMYLAKSKNIEFNFVYEITKVSLWIDHDKMDKVFFNLLSNAFKFTPSNGKIEVVLKKPKQVVDKIYESEIQIEIRDTGEGIDEIHLNKIFDQYFQSKKSHRNIGTGLGLSLSKKFIDMHRGDIKVRSTVGVGTTFLIKLPLGNQHLKEEELKINNPNENFILPPPILPNDKNFKTDPRKKNSNKPLILIVDDILDVRKYLKYSLLDEYKIIEAENGEKALELALENEPELIISDVVMPVMNGFELTKNLKSNLKTCHIPIILLTAKNTSENEIEGFAEGADSYIPKPFNTEYLKVNVRKLLDQRMRMREYFKCNLEFQKEENSLSRLDRQFLNKIMSIINELGQNKDFSIEDLSLEFGISRVHLYRKIKKLTGMSVSEFINSVKLNKSIHLLRNSNKSVSEIAYDVGFSSPSYYTKCFKMHFKISPTDYRNQN